MTASSDPQIADAVLAEDDRPQGVHLVGSIPLSDSESVFRAVGESLGSHVRRVPDGETGKRSRWNSWTATTYERTKGLEMVPPPPAVEPAHIRQLHSETDEILAAVPHDELSIQWDVCQDVGIWEGYYEAYFDDPKDGVTERLSACAEKIPTDVEVGFHLCYGDFGHKHFMNPRDLGVVTEMANRLTASVSRPINWIHMPVPIDRDDDAYFAPLTELRLASETEFYLGLVHFEDGVAGAARRIRTARQSHESFGIATECGFGRRPPETIAPLLRLHAEIATPVA